MSDASNQYTLYGDNRSGNCFKVALILRMTNRPFEWRQTDVMTRETPYPGVSCPQPERQGSIIATARWEPAE